MARQPYFSGNYGSALGQIDTRPIMQGAAAQAAMYQGLGQNIGGAIEKYGLNKEKQKKQQANIKSTVNFLDSLANQDPDNAEQYEIMKAQLNDPETPLTTRNELADQGIKQLTLSQQMLQRKGLMDATSANTALTRQTKDLNDLLEDAKVDTAKSEAELKRIQATMEKFNLEDWKLLRPKEKELKLEALLNDLSGAKHKGKMLPYLQSLDKSAIAAKEDERDVREKVLAMQGGTAGVALNQIEEIKLQKDALAQKMTHIASQIAKIDKETELLGAPDPNADEIRAKLVAEAEKLGAEAAGLRDTQRRTNELLEGDSGASSAPPPIREIDPDVAAGGDLKGLGMDAANAVLGFAFGATGFKDRRDEVTNIRAMNSQLMPSLTKQISAAGSVYTQEDMKKILPQPGDDNPTMRSKLESLVPILETKVAEAKVVYLNARAGREKTNAVRIIKTMPDLIKVLKASISQKNRRSDQEEAERILGITPR